MQGDETAGTDKWKTAKIGKKYFGSNILLEQLEKGLTKTGKDFLKNITYSKFEDNGDKCSFLL